MVRCRAVRVVPGRRVSRRTPGWVGPSWCPGVGSPRRCWASCSGWGWGGPVRRVGAALVRRVVSDAAWWAELERMGVVVSDRRGWYDADALVIAEAVAGLAAYG